MSQVLPEDAAVHQLDISPKDIKTAHLAMINACRAETKRDKGVYLTWLEFAFDAVCTILTVTGALRAMYSTDGFGKLPDPEDPNLKDFITTYSHALSRKGVQRCHGPISSAEVSLQSLQSVV